MVYLGEQGLSQLNGFRKFITTPKGRHLAGLAWKEVSTKEGVKLSDLTHAATSETLGTSGLFHRDGARAALKKPGMSPKLAEASPTPKKSFHTDPDLRS
jgi:hypothetical protein